MRERRNNQGVRLVVTAVVSLLGVASCLLSVPVDGLSGGPEPDGGGPDALARAEAGDAGGDAAVASFCATQTDARFCEDFDEQPLPGAFENRTAVGASISLDPSLFASPRYSFAVTIPKDTGNADHSGGLGKAFAPSPSLSTFSAKVQLVKVPTVNGTGPSGSLMGLTCGNMADQSLYVLLLFVRPSASGAAEIWLGAYTPATTSTANLTTFAAVPVGTWQELRLTTDWTSRTFSLDAIDASGAVSLGSAVLKPPATLTLPPAWCEYAVDLFANIPQDGWSVRYDDIVIRTP